MTCASSAGQLSRGRGLPPSRGLPPCPTNTGIVCAYGGVREVYLGLCWLVQAYETHNMCQVSLSEWSQGMDAMNADLARMAAKLSPVLIHGTWPMPMLPIMVCLL